MIADVWSAARKAFYGCDLKPEALVDWDNRLRAALEAALGTKQAYQYESEIVFRLQKRNVPYGWLELADKAAACIEDLAWALAEFKDMSTCHDWYEVRRKSEHARAILKRWGLK